MSSKSTYIKNNIAEALVFLLQKKSIEDISVSLLVETAGISRTSFYNNYKNLEEVLVEMYVFAHKSFFDGKYTSMNYLFSHAYIWDNIQFFDQNSDLLLALYKWNLLDYITKERTRSTLKQIEQIDVEIIKQNPSYFMVFFGSPIFHLCLQWIIQGKQETTQALFQMMIGFIDISKNQISHG